MKWYIADLETGKPLDGTGEFAPNINEAVKFNSIVELNRFCITNRIEYFRAEMTCGQCNINQEKKFCLTANEKCSFERSVKNEI